MAGLELPKENINTHVRDSIAELEQAVSDTELIVDQRLLERITELHQTFAKLCKKGPQRLRQARSTKSRRPTSREVG